MVSVQKNKNCYGNFMSSTLENLSIQSGNPFPFGAHPRDDGVNFALAAKDAERVSLCLFDTHKPSREVKNILLDPQKNKTGDVWHIFIPHSLSSFAYAYRMKSSQLDTEYLILDPYALLLEASHSWGKKNESYFPLGKIPTSSFDWEGTRPLQIPLKDLIIYEMHVRGFTFDPSSETQHPGCYLGMIEKIPYLKELGINAIELMPIHEFNENELDRFNPISGAKLVNYFGYSTVNFFSPMTGYATHTKKDLALIECKTMIREFHKNGIEVILDVVYNHTFEGNQAGPTQCYRVLDPHGYYMIDSQGNYLNFSGCGNTCNTNHPLARELILQSLRYWVTEMHIDGFRFDLASILRRSENGTPLENPPLVEAISVDPILKNTKLIAEAWDAGGLYQVGSFYPGSRWSEWNGRYRDAVRRFIKGTAGQKAPFATVLCGSEDLYGHGRSPSCSINFVTAHDGFSLADLVSYNEKHNQENGEDNRDGCDHNDSWNCGVEGASINKKVLFLREQQMRNFHLALLISQGIPMLLMGDEYEHTRDGNNNTWCQDNQLNWFQWGQLKERSGFYRFYRGLIHFRKKEPLLNREVFLNEKDITWHGIAPYHPDWENDNRFIAFTLNQEEKPKLFIAFNALQNGQTISVPPTAEGQQWHWVVNTHNPSPHDFYEEDSRPPLLQSHFRITPYSAILLQSF